MDLKFCVMLNQSGKPLFGMITRKIKFHFFEPPETFLSFFANILKQNCDSFVFSDRQYYFQQKIVKKKL